MKHLLVGAIAGFLFLMLNTNAHAQGPAAEALAEMKKLEFLTGTWTGEAVYSMGPQKHIVSQHEVVEWKAGGSVLAITGIGKEKVAGSDQERVVHDAFAVIGYDAKAKKFTMRAHTPEGSVDADISVEGGKIVWGFDHPRAGRVRYTITHSDKGEWHEVGESSRDGGATWTQFIDMKLHKNE